MRIGVKIRCCDGVTRLFFPRVFTYSADYPEKCVLSFTYTSKTEYGFRMTIGTLRPLGSHPCPRCFIHENDLAITPHSSPPRVDNEERVAFIEHARDLVYKTGYAISYEGAEALLKPYSFTAVSVCVTVSLARRLCKLTPVPSECFLKANTFRLQHLFLPGC
jgi:hypothetical protein